MDMTSDTSLRSGDHPWTYDLLTTEPSSPYPTLSPYDDFSSLRPTTRSPPPLQVFTGQPETLCPPRSTSPHLYGQSYKPALSPTDNRLPAKRPPPQRSHALGIDIPAVPRLSPRSQFARHVKHNYNTTPQRLSLPKPPFAQTNLSPLSPHSSPSLSSSVTTAPSSPDSPYYTHQHPVFCSDWPLPHTEPIRTKRRFSNIRHAKRLPHHTEPQWEVHALIQVRDYPIDDKRHRSGPAEQWQDHKFKAEKESRHLAGSSADTGAAECLLEENELDTDLSDQPWLQTYVHYRGASFELINPRNSLLFGKRLIETPAAEIDLLIDDYLNTIEAADDAMSTQSSPIDLTPSRQLYSGPEEARRAILRIPKSSTLMVDGGGLEGQASGQGESAESAISAILAGYEHTTPSTAPNRHDEAQDDSSPPIPAHSPPVSETSSIEWLNFVRDARQASPGLPFHAAIAKAQGVTPSDDIAAASTPIATALNGHTDPATTERSYGDTNRLLQLTSQSQGLTGPVAVIGEDQLEPYPRLRRVSTSIGTIVHNYVDRLPSQALGYDEHGSLASSEAATFYNPFDAEEYERQDEGDEEADWETENVASEIDQQSNTGREQSMPFADFDYDYTLDSIKAGERNVVDEAAARDKRPVRNHDIDKASRQLSTIYSHQAVHSQDSLPSSLPHLAGIQEAKAAIERIRRERPTVFQAAIDTFLQSHGQKTADELIRVWPRNNHGKQSRLSENSFDHVLRTARMEEDKARLASQPQTIVTQHNKAAKHAGLQYSPTTDTFATVRPPTRNPFAERLLRPDITITPPQPIYRTETDLATMGHNMMNSRHAAAKRSGLRSMASMSSQTGLRDLHLTSTPTSNIGDGASHYTPITRRGGPIRPIRPGHYPHWHQNKTRHTPLAEQRWIEMDTLGLDGRPTRSAAPPTLRRRDPEPVGRRIFNRHFWNPVALLMLWGGAYDNTVAIETGDEYRAVDRELKIDALKWAILEIAAAVMAATIIAMFVLIGTVVR